MCTNPSLEVESDSYVLIMDQVVPNVISIYEGEAIVYASILAIEDRNVSFKKEEEDLKLNFIASCEEGEANGNCIVLRWICILNKWNLKSLRKKRLGVK